MANQITTVPDKLTKAGLSFNYGLWTQGTVVTLVNVPWDAEYRNVWESKPGELDAWINKQDPRLTISQLKHARLDRPIMIDAPFELAAQYNYVRATNPAQPVQGSLPSTYYYFIKDVRYRAGNTTELVLQLDVWATFRPMVDLVRAYVEQGHLGSSNSRQMEANGRKYLTVPEGLETGAEMQVMKVWEERLADVPTGSATTKPMGVMVVSTTDFQSDPGTKEDPNLVTATGSNLEFLPNGALITIFKTVVAFRAFMNSRMNMPWVTQGIISVTAVPFLDDMGLALVPMNIPGMPADTAFQALSGANNRDFYPTIEGGAVKDWSLSLGMPERYKKLRKFETYPYTAMELTCYTGQPLILKPESFIDRNLKITILYHLNPGSARVTAYPAKYNAGKQDQGNTPGTHDSGEFLDMATTISNFPQFMTVNNSSISYLASNKNSIAFQYDSARWDQNKANMGARTAYDQASSGMNLTSAMNNAGITQRNSQLITDNQTAGYRGAVGVGTSLLGAAVPSANGNVNAIIGGAAGAAGSAAEMMIQQNHNTQTTATSNAYANTTTNAQLANQGMLQDSNKALADYSRQGDYANAIAGIQARVQDTKMLQPSTAGQIGGDTFNLTKTGWNVFLKLKRINEGALAEIGEYWLRFGYRINRWVDLPTSLLVNTKFSYWRCQEVFLGPGTCPENYKQTIRGIFEKGVTVWAKPEFIGTVDHADNDAIAGVSY